MRRDMLTIGAFARACRLSPKALRLYDELELLRPARVDPHTGYRYYAVGQLEQARLVAWGDLLIAVGGAAGVGTVVSFLPLRMECIACPLSFPPWRARASRWLCASATGP